jgi:uncharacterized coiled-coil protein SlyX
MNPSIELTKRVSLARNSASHWLSLITSLPRRSVSEGGSPITYHYPATPKVKACSLRRAATEGGSLLTVLLAFNCIALCSTLQAVTPAPDGGYPGANTAEGQNALQSLTSGIHNTALAYQTLFSNTTGHDNMATGFQALFSNTTGNYDTANGSQALYKNTTGNDNTATGFRALYSNTTGFNNTANGYEALVFNTTGHDNIANGFKALYNNTAGFDNTANGSQALLHNTTGSSNIALGGEAGFSLTTGSFNIDIGNPGVAGEADTIRIGFQGTQSATFIAGIRGVTTGHADAVPVVIDSLGQLGTVSSSRRFKKEIKPMDQTSQAILGLQPVTFQYKSDKTGRSQFGLIAEEVADVNPDLVVRDAEGEIYSVRYEAVNAMLLNEFLKEHRKVEEQEGKVQEQETAITQLKSTAAKQEATIAKQQKQIEALTTGLQKVSERFELSSPQRARQLAGTDR